MTETLLFLSAPLAASIILAGILGYFGSHILSRGIIFIDIALAQIAALGTMIGLIMGFGEESLGLQLISYFFTVLIITAYVFLRSGRPVLPQEAVIGIIYCVGLTFALILAEQIPGGSNYITKTITGNILWVTWDKILGCMILFLAVGLLHVFLGRSFIRFSDHSDRTLAVSWKDRLIEWLFYVSFGIIVVKAVLIGGVFLVFTLLIAPSAAATLFTASWRKRIVWSWIIGIIGSVAGIFLSYYLNISNGPAIVCLLSMLVFILAFTRLAMPQNNYSR